MGKRKNHEVDAPQRSISRRLRASRLCSLLLNRGDCELSAGAGNWTSLDAGFQMDRVVERMESVSASGAPVSKRLNG